MGRFRTLSLVLLIVFAGVVPFVGAAETQTTETNGDASATPPADPETDTIGWEEGYWHNESVHVDQSDGLSDAEMNRYVARAMARVEHVRQREFQQSVEVEVISREKYKKQANETTGQHVRGPWNDQVWEALFIVGENQDTASVLSETRGAAVAGFYSPSAGNIKIITETPERPVINNGTLVHELTHALQDQHDDLNSSTYRSETQDGQLAISGVVEGEANYVQARYTSRCGKEWNCVETPSKNRGGNNQPPNLGVLLTLLQPYSDGPVYVHRTVQQHGWEGFSERFSNPPTSTEQVIHYTDEKPTPISYEDRARNGWSLFGKRGVNGSDTVGEASIYTMFWYQARTQNANTVDVRALGNVQSPYDRYNYSAPPSAGWANDRVFPYHKGTGENAKYGYVWVTEWDTGKDAREFQDAYLAILNAHDAKRTDAGYLVIADESDPFADAYLVVRNGTRVTIVNGPSVDAVKDIRPELDPSQAAPTGGAEEGTTTPGDGDSGGVIPGFGAALAAVALGAFTLYARTRR